MNVDLGSSIISLARGRTVALEDATGTTIVCVGGLLWITEQHRVADVLLEPGECFTLTGDGKAVVTALAAGAMRLVDPAPGPIRSFALGIQRWWTAMFDIRAMQSAARRYGTIV